MFGDAAHMPIGESFSVRGTARAGSHATIFPNLDGDGLRKQLGNEEADNLFLACRPIGRSTMHARQNRRRNKLTAFIWEARYPISPLSGCR